MFIVMSPSKLTVIYHLRSRPRADEVHRSRYRSRFTLTAPAKNISLVLPNSGGYRSQAAGRR